uniref:CD96 molecule n=1 Tax=Crocodylus porosus TaxID=8502 RepID=A0A7M4EU00_CROPO
SSRSWTWCTVLEPKHEVRPRRESGAVTIIKKEAIHAVPGSNVTLMCTILKESGIHITQTQWSKIEDGQHRTIAVHHPVYGIQYLPLPLWILHFHNVSLSLSGLYECSFTTFPAGLKTAEISLTVKAEEEQHYVKKTLLKQILTIPCHENVISEFDWKTFCLCFKQRDNGSQIKLITKNSYQHEANKTNNLLYKDRIQLGPENALQISPLKTIDDGKAFSCLVTYHPERIVKRTTTVKVFGKRLTLTPVLCLSLLLLSTVYSHVLAWIDGFSIVLSGTSIEAEEPKESEGFYELTSLLMIQNTNQSETKQTAWCTCEFPFPWNEARDISSEEIVVYFGMSTYILYRLSLNNNEFPWPAVMTILLLFCTFIIILGVRKWCQYQREIMNRPPSFKPPPPPIKYVSIQDSDGSTPTCHELETL